ncbi:MAG: hypothetical protein K0R39_1683 [Symbiobacteriaceae bacterium]|jgi:phage protein D|nr:hypothetical protein [Symbiobacteriaceae bacterium]
MTEQSTAIAVLIDGKQVEGLDERLTAMLVEETENGISRCELTFENYVPTQTKYIYFDGRLALGQAVKVKAGGQGTVIFEGVVTGLEGRFPQTGWPEIVVLAEDALQPMRMNRRTRTFLEMTDEAIIKTIAGEHGLSVKSGLQGGEKQSCVVQLNQTDLAFVRDRADRLGAVVGAEGKTLHLAPRPARNNGDLTLTYDENLLEFSVLADLAAQRTKVVVTGWDPAEKAAVKAEATASAISSELSGLTGSSGPLKKLARVDAVEQIVQPLPVSAQEAKALAEGAYAERARRYVTGTGLALGNPGLRVAAKVDLQGLGPLFSGKYRVTEVKHLYTLDLGYRTQFRAERPGTGS